MATPFSNIYTRFLRKITDYKLSNIMVTSPIIGDSRLYGWLDSATTKFDECKSDLSDINVVLKQFNSTLLVKEEEILAHKMLIEWFEPEVNNILAMESLLSDSDFKQYSPANLLSEKQDRLNNIIKVSDRLVSEYDNKIFDYTGLR